MSNTAKQFQLSDLIAKQAKVLEADSRGPKALLLNKTIYKIFYNTRHPIRGKLFPKSKQFAKNCQKLNNKGFNAPSINQIYFDPDIKADILSYQCIDGISAREFLLQNENSQKLIGKENIVKSIASLMADLHKNGILFRSFHLGNIIVADSDIYSESSKSKLALIDVADLRFFPFALTFKQRLRNFRHFTRVIDDRILFSDDFISVYSNEYAESADLLNRQRTEITKFIQKNIKQ